MRKRGKYGAIKTNVDGITFASKAEAARYVELKALEAAGEINGLELQPKFACVIDGKKVCDYFADFAYFTRKKRVIEDVKGIETAVFRLKKKLVEALYPGVEIEVVKSARVKRRSSASRRPKAARTASGRG